MGGLDLRPHIEKFRRRFAEVESVLNDPKGELPAYAEYSYG